MLWQPELPARYRALSEAECAAAITQRREQLGESLLILGHHYQQDEVIQHADFTGDSLKLSQLSEQAARERHAKWIVFCGVHFMAETADVVNDGRIPVILPDLSAGCSMADMAQAEDVAEAWERLSAVHARDGVRVVPVTYVNSSAAVKALVGQYGGACCTSSNARQVLEWAFAGGDEPLAPGQRVQVFFLPDQHLGRNTARQMGMVSDVDARRGNGTAEMAVWNPKADSGGLDEETIRRSRLLLWAGHCSVHKMFRAEHVEAVRERNDGTTVIVHPECCQEVVEQADLVGSTEFIISQIERAEAGSRWAVGTEIHLVQRLAQQARQRSVSVSIVSDCQCLCTTMYRIDQAHILWALDHLAEGRVVNRVQVHPEARRWATVAIDRMMRLSRPLSGAPGQRSAADPASQLSALVD